MDAQSINDKFNVVKQNENQITNQINKQTVFNKEAIIRFKKKNTTSHIIINNFIKNHDNKIYKTLNDENNEIHLIQYITRINFNIDILHIKQQKVFY